MRIPLGTVSSILLVTFGAFAQQYNISTVAGGTPIPDKSNATSAPLGGLGAVASDPAGNIYFISNDCVFADQNGTLVRVAGNSRVGFSGDGGAATIAQLNRPGGLAVDGSGNLYIADSGNNRIRKVTMGTGTITTIAGLATAGYSGDNGPASSAALNNPQGLAIDNAGMNLYIADAGNNVIRKISNNTITTVAGNGTPGASGDGQIATNAQLFTPMGVAIDASLNIYIADSNNHRIREVQSGTMNTIAGNGIPAFAGDNGPARSAELNFPTAVAVDPTGNIYVNDFNNFRVRKFTLNGTINTVPNSFGIVKMPVGIAVDPNSNLYVADSSAAQILRFAPSGTVPTPIAGQGGGALYYLGDGGPATSAQLGQPEGLAVDVTGVYIADRAEGRIRKILPGGTISSPQVGNVSGPVGVAVDASANTYIADAAGSQVFKVSPGGAVTLIAGNQIAGFQGDNGSAQSAELNNPSGVAVDSAGNVYIADTVNNRIRKVTFNNGTVGIITTIAGNSTPSYGGDNGLATNALVNQPTGVTLDSAGNIYVADTGNNRIRKIAATGIITTVAGNGNNTYSGDGGQATAAGISSPHGVAVDSLGNLYISDYSGRVRKVSVSGIVTTIAGTGTQGYSGDSGPALNAQLTTPWGVAVDSSGNVYVSDVGGQAVRLLTPVAAAPLSVVTPSPLPAGIVGMPYAQALSATGGNSPYFWSILTGTLPNGLTLSPAGSITGTPTVAGSFLIKFQVTDTGSLTANATLEIDIASSAPAGLTITASATMVPAVVGVNYSQPLTATSGNPPYSWTLISGALPSGLALAGNGTIFGTPATSGTSTFIVRVNDSSGAFANSGNLSLTVLAGSTLTRTGVLAHIAVGGTWTTRVYLTNISTGPLAVNLVLHADDGTLLTVPMTVTQQGAPQQVTANSLNGALNSNTAMVIDCGAQIAATVTGWIDVLSSGSATSLAGFAIFRTTEANGGPASEGTAALQTQFESKMDLPFDDTGGFVTGVAVANLSPNAGTVTATILDVNGNLLGTYPIPLAGNGHTSFLFPAQFPVTTNKQGIVQFVNNSGGAVAGIGLRASTASGTFTSVPVILP